MAHSMEGTEISALHSAGATPSRRTPTPQGGVGPQGRIFHAFMKYAGLRRSGRRNSRSRNACNFRYLSGSTMTFKERRRIVVAGGGAAGYFAAITCAEADPAA